MFSLICLYNGQGRIRTSVARKERQIYSLLPLAARPPVRALDPALLPPKRDSQYGETTIIQGYAGPPQLPLGRLQFCSYRLCLHEQQEVIGTARLRVRAGHIKPA